MPVMRLGVSTANFRFLVRMRKRTTSQSDVFFGRRKNRIYVGFG